MYEVNMKTTTVELEKEEAKLIEESIKSMSGRTLYDSGHSEQDFKHSVKEKVVLTKEDEGMLYDLHETFHECIIYEIYDIREKEGNGDRRIRMLEIWYNLVEGSLIENNNTFHVDISFEYDILLER